MTEDTKKKQNVAMFYIGVLFLFVGTFVAFGWQGVGVVAAIIGAVFVVMAFLPDPKP